MSPFLTIVTRCCKRRAMLSKCIESVLALSDHDIEQIFIVDREQVGVPRANRFLAENIRRVDGEYVYILDDDTKLTNPDFVGLIRRASERKPGVIMVKSHRPQLKPYVLPKESVWGNPRLLRVATTNCLTYVVQADLWKANVYYYGARAAGDWAFLYRLRSTGCEFEWVDEIVAETQQLGRGRKFEDGDPLWFERVALDYRLEEVEPGDWRLRLWKELLTQPEPPAPEPPSEVEESVASCEDIQPIPVQTTPERKPISHPILGRRMK